MTNDSKTVDTGGKVGYWLLPNFTHSSDAYLDEMPEGREILRGTDKHTDEPVAVRWTGERYEQLPSALEPKCPHGSCKFGHSADACGWCPECSPEVPEWTL